MTTFGASVNLNEKTFNSERLCYYSNSNPVFDKFGVAGVRKLSKLL